MNVSAARDIPRLRILALGAKRRIVPTGISQPLQNSAFLRHPFHGLSGAEEDVWTQIVGTAASSYWWGTDLSPRLIDGKGLDGMWNAENGCAHTSQVAAPIEWFSLELDSPKTVTRVQIANRVDCCTERGENISITIGPSKVYDPNEPLCLPNINELVQEPGLQDYVCTGELNEGKFVKISRPGTLNLCEVKVFTLHSNMSMFASFSASYLQHKLFIEMLQLVTG